MVLRTLKTCVLDFCIVSVVWSIWVNGSTYGFQFVEWSRFLFLSLVVNFKFFNSYFFVTTLGLNLLSGACFNKLLSAGCPVTQNSSI